MVKKTKIINKALAIPRVAKRVKKLNISQQQLENALIILLQIIEENELKKEPKFLTSFNIEYDGSLSITKILSKSGEKETFINRLIAQHITPINTLLQLQDIDRTKERLNLGLFIKRYNQQDNPKGFYLYGGMGIGKTYIAQAMANKLVKNNETVAFLNVIDLVVAIKNKFRDGYEEFLEELKNVQHLFLDDLGSETITSWFRDEVLLCLLSYRMNNNLSVFITSNFSYNELLLVESKTKGNQYPEKQKSLRLLERIKSLTEEVFISGHNRRY